MNVVFLQRRWWAYFLVILVLSCAVLALAAGSGWAMEKRPSTSSSDEDLAEGHIRLGVDFFLTDELEIAIEEFREAARQRPGYAEAYHNLGVALAKTGDLTGAISAWSKAERLDPQTVSLGYNLSSVVWYNYGISLLRAARLKDAIEEWGRALVIQPNFVEAYYAVGLGYLEAGNPILAREHFLRALHLAPSWPPAHEGLGLAYYQSHEFSLARKAWREALDLNPDAVGVKANLGMLALEEGNFSEAIDYSHEALKAKPDLAAAHFNLGLSLYKKGEEQASLSPLQKAWSLDSSLTDAPLVMGVVWSHQGQWAKAVAIWRDAIYKGHSKPGNIQLHFNIGTALATMGDFSGAAGEFAIVVNQHPRWVPGWIQLGHVHMGLRQWTQAEEAFEKAVALEPSWGNLHYSRGKILVEQGRLEEAGSAFERAVEVEPQFVEALYQLGLIWLAKDRPGKAIEPLRQAAEGGSHEAQELLASMYANGSGVDRNLPQAMLWWFRHSQAGVGTEEELSGTQQLSRLRRNLHHNRFSEGDREDVLLGFHLIRQDLENRNPLRTGPDSGMRGNLPWQSLQPSDLMLSWVVQKALAFDKEARRLLANWYKQGVPGNISRQNARIRDYFLQTIKEEDPDSCRTIQELSNTETGKSDLIWKEVLHHCPTRPQPQRLAGKKL